MSPVSGSKKAFLISRKRMPHGSRRNARTYIPTGWILRSAEPDIGIERRKRRTRRRMNAASPSTRTSRIANLDKRSDTSHRTPQVDQTRSSRRWVTLNSICQISTYRPRLFRSGLLSIQLTLRMDYSAVDATEQMAMSREDSRYLGICFPDIENSLSMKTPATTITAARI